MRERGDVRRCADLKMAKQQDRLAEGQERAPQRQGEDTGVLPISDDPVSHYGRVHKDGPERGAASFSRRYFQRSRPECCRGPVRCPGTSFITRGDPNQMHF